jgi:hypothetical protein
MPSIILNASNFQAWVPDLLQISERSTDSRETDDASLPKTSVYRNRTENSYLPLHHLRPYHY